MRYAVLGLLDGMITAIGLTSGALIRGHSIGLQEAASIAVVVATINGLTSFVAEYSHQRASLRDIEYKISLRSTGRILRSLVHRRALARSLRSALFMFASSLAGASSVLIPASIKAVFGLYALGVLVLAASIGLAKTPEEFGEWLVMIGASAAVGLAVGLLFPLAA
ncbi:hypothetical protein TUZN_1626 [Thermoproteus uzoniensis 768-20]|uniref:VIT family protein n=1 Tax=Thermoproteus uzoniensis (strain 768-20) TaxID=999630 RepID=F2L2P5_THEU7|nr:hypothetical protein [Thermoproteus uzoniensis]AEA13093.1 hypothetical protein TUZN_1626 [Thermoproteus uzoniensis 768-20]